MEVKPPSIDEIVAVLSTLEGIVLWWAIKRVKEKRPDWLDVSTVLAILLAMGSVVAIGAYYHLQFGLLAIYNAGLSILGMKGAMSDGHSLSSSVINRLKADGSTETPKP